MVVRLQQQAGIAYFVELEFFANFSLTILSAQCFSLCWWAKERPEVPRYWRNAFLQSSALLNSTVEKER